MRQFLIFILALCFLSSCTDRRKVSVMLRDFMEIEIAVPDDLVPLYRKSLEAGTFSLMTIFSPGADDVEDVRVELMLNSPSDSRFHYFLMNSSAHPVFVGNPLGSAALERLMDTIVE